MTIESPRLSDVAQAAGVSVSTASSALNRTGRVSKTTATKVRKIAKSLGYQPSSIARSLRSGLTHAVGLYHVALDSVFNNDYIEKYVFGVLKSSHAHSYDLTLLANNRVGEDNAIPRVDGIIVTDPITGDARTESLFHTGIPIVASERFAKTSKYNAPIVCIDHQSALMKIFYRASELGCRHPSLICPEPESSGWGEIITKMFNTWCTRMGITGYVEHLPFSRESEAEVAMKVSGLLSRNPDVDFFLAASEIEIGEIERQLIDGRNPHGGICHIASCSDSKAIQSMPLPVTAINLRPYDLGWLTCQLLFELIGGSDVHDFTLEGGTVFRGTMQ